MAKMKQHGRNHNSLETLGELSDSLTETLASESKKTADTFLSQLLGIKSPDKSAGSQNQSDEGLKVTNPFNPGSEGDIFHAKDHRARADLQRKHADKAPEKPRKAASRAEAAIDHHGEFRRSSERASTLQNREINQRLQEIMAELKRLVSTSKMLQMEFANVDVEQAPTQAGEYHINFFDWLLLTIRAARQKVENSGAWLATAKGKGGKKKWGKKERQDWFGNTSRSLSSEVTASNQTG